MFDKARRLIAAGGALVAAGWFATPARAGSESVTFVFPSTGLGHGPEFALARNGGTAYGITAYSGVHSRGDAYAVTPHAARLLHRFAGEPSSALLEVGGTLYGTTSTGGTSRNCSSYGCGTIYRIAPSGAYSAIYSFTGRSDGTYPQGRLSEIGGTLYGVTAEGGTGCHGRGCGTVFSISPDGTFKTLYAFKGGADGVFPEELITDGSTLYGTTSEGGVLGGSCAGTESPGCGTIFAMTLSGAKTTLHAFPDIAHGAYPSARLLKVGDRLIGTTRSGGTTSDGSAGYGIVFEVSLSGAFRQLHVFSQAEGGSPFSGLTALHGTLYGATTHGGTANDGQIFTIDTQGAWSSLYSFQGGTDGAFPSGELTVHVDMLTGAAP